MKKMLVLLLISILLVKGCASKDHMLNTSHDQTRKIQELQEYIEKLENELEEKEVIIEHIKRKQDLFPTLSNLTLEFVRGHTQGDIDKIKKIVSDNISILEKDNKIYGKYETHGQEITFLLYVNDSKIRYQDMVIQGYGYDDENDFYIMHIREFYVDEYGQPYSPPTFLNLRFKEFKEGWKIVEFDFDI